MRPIPFFSRSDRRALLVLEWVIALIIMGVWVHSWWLPDRGETSQKDSTNVSQNKVFQENNKKKDYSYAEEERIETFPFDPNTADSTTLLRLGLAPWQVKSVYHYRAKHGRYHTPNDFRRLPGMTPELWERLAPNIRISPKYQYLKPEAKAPKNDFANVPKTTDSIKITPVETENRDTIKYPIKYKEGTLVDVNNADTSELKKIPGIASYRARKIVEYRTRLGGFTSVEQVMESCELPDEVLSWFMVDSSFQLASLDVNHLSVQKLMRHPYLSFYQAKAIVEYRKEQGLIQTAEELLNLDGFTSEKLEKLRPYLEFR